MLLSCCRHLKSKERQADFVAAAKQILFKRRRALNYAEAALALGLKIFLMAGARFGAERKPRLSMRLLRNTREVRAAICLAKHYHVSMTGYFDKS
jgi:hypothetical protein